MRSDRKLIATVLGGLLLAACGVGAVTPAGRAGIDTLQTDILFGLTAHTARSAPRAPAPVPAPSAPSLPGLGSLPLPTGPVETCPLPPIGANPPQVSPIYVTDAPQAGVFRWVEQGTYQLPGTTVHTAVPGEQYLLVLRVQKQPSAGLALPGTPPSYVITFQTIQPTYGAYAGAAYVRADWQVKGNPAPGDPEGGVTLTQVDLLNAKGQAVRTAFKGVAGLLLLPLPVSFGQSFNSAAVDSNGAGSLAFQGQVLNRQRVNACGDWVQGVEVTGTLNGLGSYGGAKVDLILATQSGAMPIAAGITGDWFGATLDVEGHLGAVRPKPLPGGLQ